MTWRERWIQAWPYALIAGVLIAFYYQIVLVQGAWLVADHAEQHFPWAYYLAQHIKQGILPFWTDQIHAGFPITAEGQIGTFYLPNLFFYYFFPIREGYAWNIVFHLLLSGLLMTRYLKSLGMGNRATFFGTMVYMFGSTLGGAYYNITSLKVLTWFPLTLMLADSLVLRTSWRWAKCVTLGFIFALQLLAGYQQFAAYAILFTGLYLLFRLIESPDRGIGKTIQLGLGYVLAVAISAAIAFPQLYLMFELAMLSNRADPQEGFAYVGSYSPLAMICLFFPSLEGFFVSKLYLGILPVFFIIASFFIFKKSKHKTVYFLVLLALLLALGRYSPLYVLIIKVFKFYSFRTPVKFIFFAGFFLSVLSAFGMHWLLQLQKNQLQPRIGKIYIGLLIAMTLCTIVSYMVFRYFQEPLYQLGERLLKAMIYGHPGHPFSWEHYQDKLAHKLESGLRLLDPRGKIIWIPVIKMVLSGALISFFLNGRLAKGIFYAAVLVILSGDLNFTYSDIRGDYAPYESFFGKSKTTEFLEANLKGNRYFNYSHNPSESPLPAAKNMIYGLSTANAYSPLVSKDYYHFFFKMGGINDSVGYQETDDAFFVSQLKLLGMMNVKYVVSDKQKKFKVLAPVFRDGEWTIYDNPYLRNRYQLIPEYEVIPDRQALLQKMRSGDFDPDILVLIEKSVDTFAGDTREDIIENEIKVVEQSASEILLNVSSQQDQFLRVANLYYPGWTATVNGEPAEILRANYIIMALALKRGRHEVRLRYNSITPFMEKS